MQGRRELRLDCNDANAAGIPGRDATDQPAAAYSDEERFDLWCIVFYLEPDGALADYGLGLIVCVNGECTGAGHKIFARRQSIRIAVTGDD